MINSQELFNFEKQIYFHKISSRQLCVYVILFFICLDYFYLQLDCPKTYIFKLKFLK